MAGGVRQSARMTYRPPLHRRLLPHGGAVRRRSYGKIVVMGLSDQNEDVTYRELHATVVDAIRYITAGQPIEVAAHEVLERLREQGLQIPARAD